MQIKPAQVQGFLAKPTASRVLLYGPDQGRVVDLARLLLAKFGDETVVFDGEGLTQKAEALATALSAPQSLFGGKRVVRIRGAGDRATKLLKEILPAVSGEVPLVVEAGELTGSSSLRKLFEADKGAAAIACYAPEERDLAALVRNTLQAAGIRIDGDALAYIARCLPPDTLAAKAELEKLSIYLGSRKACTLDDVRAVIDDAAEFAIQEIALAAGDGHADAMIRAFARLGNEAQPVSVLRVAQHHFQRLASARAAIDAGASPDEAVSALRPPVFFREKPRFSAQLQRWTMPQIERALGRLTEAEILVKKTGYPEEALTAHVLLDIAVGATNGAGAAAGPAGRGLAPQEAR